VFPYYGLTIFAFEIDTGVAEIFFLNSDGCNYYVLYNLRCCWAVLDSIIFYV
jgi:hypothetical protein